MPLSRISRRQLLQAVGVSAGGLTLATQFGCSPTADASAHFTPNLYINVGPDNQIRLIAARPEIGQGVRTALPMILAEEMDAAWDSVVVQSAPIAQAKFGEQSAVGSRGVFLSWVPLRRAGAAARQMLLQAAAQQWGVAVNRCRTEAGQVIHGDTGRRATYGELAERAQRQAVPMPQLLQLKRPHQYRLLGSKIPGVDNEALVRGQPLFTADAKLPGQTYATLSTGPGAHATVSSANLDVVRKLPGVLQAFELPLGSNRSGVAVVARTTFDALRAQQRLRIIWDNSGSSSGNQAGNNTADFFASAQAQLTASSDQSPGATIAGKEEANDEITATYQYAFVAHAQLEPLAALVWVQADRVVVGACSQQPNRAVTAVANALGRPANQIEFEQVRGGGAFGRRLQNDFIVQAALIAAKVNAPVLLQYRREDDFARDHLRAGGMQRLAATLDAKGQFTSWHQQLVSPSKDGETAIAGAPLEVDHKQTEFPLPLVAGATATVALEPWQLACGQWRSPGTNVMCFAVQSFIHEVAAATQRDHLALLLDLLGEDRQLPPGGYRGLDTARAKRVIRAAAAMAKLDQKLPSSGGLLEEQEQKQEQSLGTGLAFNFSQEGYVALVAQVQVTGAKRFRVVRVVAAVDVGQIINLSGAEAQVQGSIVDGLSVLANQAIDINNGAVQQTNFHQYPLLRLPSAPQIEVQFVHSGFRPTGLGEPALPPVAPAVGNALFAASGERVRNLPFSAAGWQLQ